MCDIDYLFKDPPEHDLKIWSRFFEAIQDGSKTFEIRKNDRGFLVGDQLLLREWLPDTEEYSGREIRARVTYLVAEPLLMHGAVCLGISVSGRAKNVVALRDRVSSQEVVLKNCQGAFEDLACSGTVSDEDQRFCRDMQKSVGEVLSGVLKSDTQRTWGCTVWVTGGRVDAVSMDHWTNAERLSEAYSLHERLRGVVIVHGPAPAAPEGSFRTAIWNCARCDKDHEDLWFQMLARPADHHTHWAPCPTTREPILLRRSDPQKCERCDDRPEPGYFCCFRCVPKRIQDLHERPARPAQCSKRPECLWPDGHTGGCAPKENPDD